MRVTTPLLLVALGPLGPLGGATLAADQPQTGLWKAHELTFTFMGLTSYYSCDSLASKLKLLLTLAGARKDAKVFPGVCDPMAGPSRISSAHLSFRTLVPEPSEAAPVPPAETAPARAIGRPAPVLKNVTAPEPGVGAWRSVEWRPGRPRDLDRGDCELVEQFAREVLPLFTTRSLVNHISCSPHDLFGSMVSVKFEALGPLPPAEAAVAAPPPAPPPAQ